MGQFTITAPSIHQTGQHDHKRWNHHFAPPLIEGCGRHGITQPPEGWACCLPRHHTSTSKQGRAIGVRCNSRGMLPCSDIDVRAWTWAGSPSRGLALGASSSTRLIPSHDFSCISMNIQGLGKGYVIVYIVCTSLSLYFLGSPVLVSVAGGEYLASSSS